MFKTFSYITDAGTKIIGEHHDWLEEVQQKLGDLQQEASVLEMFNCINLCQGCIVMKKKDP